MLLFLSVVCIGPMFAAEVLLYEQRVHGGILVYRERDERHLGNLFCHYCMINSLVGILAPSERTMVLYQYAWGMNRIDVSLLEAVYNNHSCIVFVFCHLVGSHIVGARYAVVKIVGMSGADIREVQTCLSPGCGIGGVGVYDTSQFRESTI